MEKKILVVDDEPDSARFMSLALEEASFRTQTVSGSVEALLAMEREVPALLLTDLRLPDLDGLELLTLAKERWPDVPVILVSVEQDAASIIEAVRRGATNYLVKPVSAPSLCAAVSRALATGALASASSDRLATEIVGSSPATLQTRHQVSLAARSDVNILITGETGTGKELVARAVHRTSSLAQGPFVAHNCAATPADLFESQFFGHLRGAFTGADRDQAGLLEEADEGILFLDELECFSPLHQAKLLRVMDDGVVRPVGSRQSRTVSVRFLAATNREPERMLAQGELREDLYYRLRGFEVRLVPLRERPQDIPALAEHFLAGKGASLHSDALAALCDYDWPGNVRQLRNVLHCALTRGRNGRIERRDLMLGTEKGPVRATAPATDLETRLGAPSPAGPREPRSLKDLERNAILLALRESGGNRIQTARTLGIHRSTLRRKIRELGIDS